MSIGPVGTQRRAEGGRPLGTGLARCPREM